MKRILVILGVLLAGVVVVIGLRTPADTPAYDDLVAPTGPAPGATTIDLGDGWFADVGRNGEFPCVSFRNDVAQSNCMGLPGLGSLGSGGTFAGRGVRLSVTMARSEKALTAVWSSKQLSGGPCCATSVPAVEISPNVWMSHLATPDEDEHWGVQLRGPDGGLFQEFSLVPPG